MTSKTENFWDKQAQKFDSGEKQSEPVYEEIIARTRKHLNLNDNVLDFGCATGTKTIQLASGTKHIHGLDISAEMIRIALKKKDEANIMNISFSKGTIFDDDLKKSSFDKIIAFAIIQLLEDNEKVIRRIHELLKPGGLFISTTACLKDKMDFKSRFEVTSYLIMKSLGIFPLHLNMFMPADVEKLIEDQNFQIVEAEKIFHRMTASFIVARKL
jgi:2-polyprenyl-3-methyl-5-hydroxy-6-metoxy-1,4-benzoquinol methylase